MRGTGLQVPPRVTAAVLGPAQCAPEPRSDASQPLPSAHSPQMATRHCGWAWRVPGWGQMECWMSTTILPPQQNNTIF